MTSSSLLIALVVGPLLGSGIALSGKILPWRRTTAVLSVSTLILYIPALILLYPLVTNGGTVTHDVGGWAAPYGITLAFDGLSWISTALIAGISILVAVAAFSREEIEPRFFFFLLLLIAGMQGVVVTTDLFNMFVSFEIVAIAAYVLIAYEQKTTALVASVKYLILSTVGILFFLLGVLLIYRESGTLALGELEAILQQRPELGRSGVMHLALAALCVGIGVRTAFIPFHTWLPEAHAYAPHPVSAILSGVLIKVSFLALVRILAAFRADYLNELLMWIGGLTALAAVLWALSQTDAKRLLAYHSISQMGYILAAYGIGSSLGVVAAVTHAVNHALFKSLLFLAVGSAVDVGGSRNLYRIGPLGRATPVVALTFFVGALSISGLPPFNGYVSKALIGSATSSSLVYVLILITGVGTVASFIKLSRIYLFREHRAESATPSGPTHRRHAALAVAVVTLALACIATGVFGRALTGLYGRLLSGVSNIVAEEAPKPVSAYAPRKLLQTAATVALGVGLYFAVVSRPAASITHKLRSLAPDTETVLFFFFAGLLLFGLVAYV
jgi:multicomponent Na+:H+ antiporter subunit D